ncbi:hypothetical protein [Planosporangium thailandense]|nr:hypothetical protein [Planosporangium thailandense]
METVSHVTVLATGHDHQLDGIAARLARWPQQQAARYLMSLE